ncbi:hypothetical protein ABPG77_009052 [Micractinium sp. CCAP 211/92]
MRACLVALLLFVAIGACFADVDDQRIARLQTLARRGGGLIELDQNTFNELLVGKSRPYSVFVVGDAKDLRRDPKLRLVPLVSDFKLVAKAFAATNAGKPAAGQAFFARMEFARAQHLFGRMGIKALPYLARIPPSLAVTEGGAISVPAEEVLPTSGYPWGPERIAEFVSERTGLAVGEVKHAPLISPRVLPLVSLAVLACIVYVGYKLYYAPCMRHQALYAVGALCIYWFSVSGGMFNIIRGVPLVGFDHRNRQAMLFMQGQGQLGAEGFIMGTLYTTVGLSVATLITLVPKIKDSGAQRVAAYATILVAFFAFRMVTSNHLWKTGMSTSWYLF